MPGRNDQNGERYRYGYQGEFAEMDEETGWNQFELRSYDPRVARWMTIDPEYQHYSPYLAMGNNPVNRIDPDGGVDGGNCDYCDNSLSTNTNAEIELNSNTANGNFNWEPITPQQIDLLPNNYLQDIFIDSWTNDFANDFPAMFQDFLGTMGQLKISIENEVLGTNFLDLLKPSNGENVNLRLTALYIRGKVTTNQNGENVPSLLYPPEAINVVPPEFQHFGGRNLGKVSFGGVKGGDMFMSIPHNQGVGFELLFEFEQTINF